MAKRLVMVRHGETDWNAAGRLQGQVDIPLNETGKAQAREAGEALARRAAEEGFTWEIVATSPLGRAVESAELIAEVLGVEVGDQDDDLVERAYGELEGLVGAELDDHERQRLIVTAEPEEQVAERGAAALARIAGHYPDGNVVVVAHGTLIRLTANRILDQKTPRIPNGVAVEIDAARLAEFVESTRRETPQPTGETEQQPAS
ncbi:histidine phosphatase family protein [Zhihengliuella sp.]|uniref:histidine phosphatase family protein n=1 Tax=Zhihengliuella sp. TaxID=1954483 RepID=UPI00281205B3|nr:histidine phosphatase family protein [Zhihengliuella sp.]